MIMDAFTNQITELILLNGDKIVGNVSYILDEDPKHSRFIVTNPVIYLFDTDEETGVLKIYFEDYIMLGKCNNFDDEDYDKTIIIKESNVTCISQLGETYSKYYTNYITERIKYTQSLIREQKSKEDKIINLNEQSNNIIPFKSKK